MYTNFKHLSMVVASLVLIGCGGGGTSGDGTVSTDTSTSTTTSTSTSSETVNKNITITEEQQIESLGMDKSIHATVEIGDTPKSLYVLLSNYSQTETASASITDNAKVVNYKKTTKKSKILELQRPNIFHASQSIQNFNEHASELFVRNNDSQRQLKTIESSSKSNKDTEGSSVTIYLDQDGYESTQTTVKKVIDITTSFGTKTLSILVSDDSFQEDFSSGCSKSKCVTQEMVDALADTFLQSGEDNDIYDWVTNIFGEEWGDDAEAIYSNLISENDEITILLTDIDGDDSPTGGTIGYFWSKDNIEKSSLAGSNERIMFYVDSVMFANGEGEWDIDDFWPKELVATLAHEFQHMIHFYQKTVLLDATDDTWINEMLSETTEDLIATKIRHSGPRGISPDDGSAGEPGNTDGRYPLFNENNTLSLTSWNNTLADYSKVNAFGTFLTRNYGGAKVLHDIMYNNKEHEDAVEEATGKSFNTLLKEWGTAVLLSSQENLEDMPTYNTGDFTLDTYNDITYKLGSINFYNYDPQPIFESTSGSVSSQGNYYYKIGDNLTGTVIVDLTLNGTTEATLIAE